MIRSGRIRPERVALPAVGTIVLVLAWEAVAHESGSGWVQAVGTVVVALLLFGLLAPAIVLRRIRVSCRTSPADAVAGSPVVIELRATKGCRVVPRVPFGETVILPAGEAHAVVLSPARRGVFSRLELTVASAAPFGLLWWTTTVEIPLQTVLHVSPRVGPPTTPVRTLTGDIASPRRSRASGSEEPAGVRPYMRGDTLRRIHWPASAHASELMVRVANGEDAQPVLVVAEIPFDEELAERRAEEVLGTVVNLLERGVPVVLETTESAGTLRMATANRTEAGRRMASAEPRR